MSAVRYPVNGFGISNFRSFGPQTMHFGPFEKINVIIGSNNSGKSNVLRFIRNVYPSMASFSSVTVKQDDLNLGSSNAAVYPILAKIDFIDANYAPLEDLVGEMAKRDGLPPEYLWVDVNPNGSVNIDRWRDMEPKYGRQVERSWMHMSSSYGGDFKSSWMPQVLKHTVVSGRQDTPTFFVPAYRKLNSRLDAYAAEYGVYDPSRDDKIIEELAEISQPPYDKQHMKEDFRKIVRFIRQVLNEPELEMEIPFDRKTITVHLHSKSLPIEALGTGIHELVILASRVVMKHEAIICLEEPELHFHPELQRQFMRFIYEETDNQYFITTHSAHIMDAVPCTVHRVYLEDGKSKVLRPITGGDRREICHELGYKPSDLLQSNCIIWVEGPSDRIYVNYWLATAAPELTEGLHYSVMFYGGALRSHLTGSEDSVTDLIQLLPINRFPVMIFDSDKSNEDAIINASKQRIKDELDATGLCWMTAGREIENYIRLPVLEEAVKQSHPRAASLASKDRVFGKPLDYVKEDGSIVADRFDKVAIAKRVAHAPVDLTVLDLSERVSQLVAFVRKANRIVGLSAS